jgi:hypothetical protein
MSKSYPTGGFGYQEPQDTKTQVESRKSSFGKLARLIHNGGGWVTSYPGLSYMTFDALDGSQVPQQLRDLGYDPVDEGPGERILPSGITERYLIEGSSVPVVRHHAGITKVKKWVLDL